MDEMTRVRRRDEMFFGFQMSAESDDDGVFQI